MPRVSSEAWEGLMLLCPRESGLARVSDNAAVL